LDLIDENEKLIEETFEKVASKHGNIGKADIVLRNLRKNLNTELTTYMIENLFSETVVSYYFKDSKDKKDFYVGNEENILKTKRRPLCKFVKLKNIPELIHDFQYLLFFYTENTFNSEKLYEWRPCYIGGKDFLFSKFLPQLEGNPIIHPKYFASTTLENRLQNGEYSYRKFLEIIYDNLFNKEKWKNEEDSNGSYYNRLNRYLTYLTESISNKIDTLNTEYYAKTTKDNVEYILINSRLLNKFGSWIYLSYKIRKSYNRHVDKMLEDYHEPQIINNYQSAYSAGYINTTLNNIKPIQFYTNPSDLIFRGDIDSFDLDDSQHFQHMLEDRNNRLPDSLRDKTVMELATRFKSSIEYALKMKEMDYNYIVPSYGIARDCVQFLIPFYDEFAPDKLPSGVIVTNKIGEKWVLNTILNLSDAYDVARLLAIPATNWI